MPAKIPKKKVAAAIAELKKVRKSWLRRPGVTGLDVGFRMRGQVMTNELAIRVHVARKVPTESLASPSEAFAESGRTTKLGDFVVDVIEADYGLSSGAADVVSPEDLERTGRADPLVGGVSMSNGLAGAGTLGAVVWDTTDGEPCVLSNWHVLCRRKACKVGEKVYQPGPRDGGRSRDTVATLKRWQLDRHADAALAQLTGARAFTRDILGLDPVPGMTEPELGMLLIKSGRSSKLTKARIDGLGFSFTMDYGGGGRRAFEDQIHIVPRAPWPDPSHPSLTDYEISVAGDSGSLWIDEATGRAVGLHFAGETTSSISAEFAVANRITTVAEQLKFSFAPMFRAAAPAEEERTLEAVRQVLCRNFPALRDETSGAEVDRLLGEVRDELRRLES